MRLRVCVGLLLLTSLLLAGIVAADDDAEKLASNVTAEDRAAARAALEEFNSLIGEWRGVGQVRRGSNRGAWLEQAEWVWRIKSDQPALRYKVEKGNQLKTATLTYVPAEKIFHLVAVLPDDAKRKYAGQLEDGKLVLESPADADGAAHRITVTRLNEKRTLVLFQKRGAKQKRFSRVAEVGYTREGTKLAEVGGGSPECIVTGGKGTSTIEYKGKTYYLCCSGCREAFLDDPEGIIAEAKERLEKRRAKKSKAGQKKS